MNEPFLPGHYYHVYHHAAGKFTLFRDDGDYQTFLMKYSRFLGKYQQTYAYCLMPNHFHMLVRASRMEEEAEGLTQKWSNFLNGYAQSFNRKHGTWGSVFQRHLPRKLVTDEDALKLLVHYIHYNPVKHGFTTNPWRWKYSSLRALLSEQPTKLAREDVISWFGGINVLRTFTESGDLGDTDHIDHLLLE